MLINNGAKITAQPGDLVAPCGCMLITRQTPTGEPVVSLIPHDIDCDLVKASIDEAIKANKTVELVRQVDG